MSRGRKRNVAFIKPDEPDFLKRMKAEIGYREPEDTVDTKRGPVGNFSDDDDDDYQEKDDEKPLVVQVKTGDLTEEEAAKLAKEEAEKPADLTQKIVFKMKRKEKPKDESLKKETGEKSSKRKSDKKEKTAKNLLSFEDEDEG